VNIVLQAGFCCDLKEEFSIEKACSAAAKQQQQINYTIRALIRAKASVATVSHFHHVEQARSLFTPHPLLPHKNACYYSRIILNSLLLLLFSQHNYLRPRSELKIQVAWCTSEVNSSVDCNLQVGSRQHHHKVTLQCSPPTPPSSLSHTATGPPGCAVFHDHGYSIFTRLSNGLDVLSSQDYSLDYSLVAR